MCGEGPPSGRPQGLLNSSLQLMDGLSSSQINAHQLEDAVASFSSSSCSSAALHHAATAHLLGTSSAPPRPPRDRSHQHKAFRSMQTTASRSGDAPNDPAHDHMTQGAAGEGRHSAADRASKEARPI